jgi:parallel beta-helix repeat protein
MKSIERKRSHTGLLLLTIFILGCIFIPLGVLADDDGSGGATTDTPAVTQTSEQPTDPGTGGDTGGSDTGAGQADSTVVTPTDATGGDQGSSGESTDTGTSDPEVTPVPTGDVTQGAEQTVEPTPTEPAPESTPTELVPESTPVEPTVIPTTATPTDVPTEVPTQAAAEGSSGTTQSGQSTTQGGFNQSALDAAAASYVDPPLNQTAADPNYHSSGQYWIINTPEHYTLENSYTAGTGSGDIFGIWIQVSGVVLDGLNNILTGNGAGSGIRVESPTGETLSDISISNIGLTNWDTGIVFVNVVNGLIDSVTISNGNTGIVIQGSNSIQIANSHISDMRDAGIVIKDSDWVNVVNNIIEDVGLTSSPLDVTGIEIVNGSNNNASLNLIQKINNPSFDRNASGILIRDNLQKTGFTYVMYNNISQIGSTRSATGVLLRNTTQNILVGNKVSQIMGMDASGITIEGSATNGAFENTIMSSLGTTSAHGISVKNSSNTVLWSNNITQVSSLDSYGMRLQLSKINNVQGNTISQIIGNKATGIALENTTGSIVADNTIFQVGGFDARGISLAGSSDNIIYGNKILQLAGADVFGVTLDNSSYNNITLQKISNVTGISAYGMKLSDNSNRNKLIGNDVNEIYGVKDSYGVVFEDSSKNILRDGTTELIGTTSARAARSELAQGISLFHSDNNSISNTTVKDIQSSGRSTGILLEDSRNNTISGTTVTDVYGPDHSSGITFSNSPDNHADLNTITRIGIAGPCTDRCCGEGDCAGSWESYGILARNATNSTITRNTISEVRAWPFKDDPPQASGISLVNTNGSLVYGNTITDVTGYKASGISLKDSYQNLIKNNNISEVVGQKAYGIGLKDSDSNLVYGNDVKETFGFPGIGISLVRSDNNNISSNLVYDESTTGISLKNADDNLIYNNYLNNPLGKNVRVDWKSSGNVWNVSPTAGMNIIGGSSIGGNYYGAEWDQPGYSQICTDENLDGFCDDSYDVKHRTVVSPTATPTPKNVDNHALTCHDVVQTDSVTRERTVVRQCDPVPAEVVQPVCYDKCIDGTIHHICTVDDPILITDIDTGVPCEYPPFECKDICEPDGYVWSICYDESGKEISRTNTGRTCTYPPFECKDICMKDGQYWAVCFDEYGNVISVTPTGRKCGNGGGGGWYSSISIPKDKGCCNSSFINHTIPSTMCMGQYYPVAVSLMNSCTDCWLQNDTYLYAMSPDAIQFGPSEIPVTKPCCGTPYTFQFTLKAPEKQGTYYLMYQLWHKNATCGDIMLATVDVKQCAGKQVNKVTISKKPEIISTGCACNKLKQSEFANEKFATYQSLANGGSPKPFPTIAAMVTGVVKTAGNVKAPIMATG